MSCVIAFKDSEGKTWFGCDSAISNHDEIRTIKMPKVFHYNGITIGFCGLARVGQVIMHYGQWDKVETLEDLIVTIKSCLEEAGALNTHPDGDVMCKANLLVGFKGEIFEIDEMFQVIDVDEDYTAIGSGKPYALGCLYGMKDQDIDPQERMGIALECSGFYSPFVRGPYKIFEINDDGTKKPETEVKE